MLFIAHMNEIRKVQNALQNRATVYRLYYENYSGHDTNPAVPPDYPPFGSMAYSAMRAAGYDPIFMISMACALP